MSALYPPFHDSTSWKSTTFCAVATAAQHIGTTTAIADDIDRLESSLMLFSLPCPSSFVMSTHDTDPTAAIRVEARPVPDIRGMPGDSSGTIEKSARSNVVDDSRGLPSSSEGRVDRGTGSPTPPSRVPVGMDRVEHREVEASETRVDARSIERHGRTVADQRCRRRRGKAWWRSHRNTPDAGRGSCSAAGSLFVDAGGSRRRPAPFRIPTSSGETPDIVPVRPFPYPRCANLPPGRDEALPSAIHLQ